MISPKIGERWDYKSNAGGFVLEIEAFDKNRYDEYKKNYERPNVAPLFMGKTIVGAEFWGDKEDSTFTRDISWKLLKGQDKVSN